jgi:hypothetical protein
MELRSCPALVHAKARRRELVVAVGDAMNAIFERAGAEIDQQAKWQVHGKRPAGSLVGDPTIMV